jgi:hypothetical protein
MRNFIVGAISLTTLLMFLMVRCTTPVAGGGSSSETVVGKVVNSDGSPACSTVVTLYPSDYDPIHDGPLAQSTTDTTDADGVYSVVASDSTIAYSIVATKVRSGTRALVPVSKLEGDTTRAVDAVLAQPATIIVTVPDNADIINGYLYIPGTGIAVFLNGNAEAVFSQVPGGAGLSVNYATRSASNKPVIVNDQIEVAAGDTVAFPYPHWRYSRKLYLNTTASGAGVSTNVTDFPVLVRLTSKNFDFTQARPAGADVRFTGASGIDLSFEIERWDTTAKAAAIWVRLPVVRGNNDKQYIMMYWGASAADAGYSLSNSMAVFDTACGFAGVWHFSESGSGTTYDATANNYHGTPYGMTAASVVAGAIGGARDFDGSSSYIVMQNTAAGNLNIRQNGDYAVSVWVNADSIDTIWHAIAGKGHEQYYLKFKCLTTGKATWEFVEFQDQKGWDYTEDSIPPAPGIKQWVHLTGVRSGSRQYLYINGEVVDDSIGLMAGDYPRNTNDNFTVGRHSRQVTIPYGEGWCYFNGKIDEVRVMKRAPDAAWIRLCYMNQKADDALIKSD